MYVNKLLVSFYKYELAFVVIALFFAVLIQQSSLIKLAIDTFLIWIVLHVGALIDDAVRGRNQL